MAGAASHGEQRQLEIAITLATEPQVLLIGEPPAGMGPAEAERMLELLLSLKPRHAIMPVENDMDAVFTLADHLTVMVNGTVIASGGPRQCATTVAYRPPISALSIAATDEPLLIDTEGLHSCYGSSHILRGVNLRPRRGETLGLMGRNGMGESTLLKSLMGLVKPRAGTVRIAAHDMTTRAPSKWRGSA